MAIDKAVDSAKLDAALTYTANRIRAKTSGTAQIAWDVQKGFGDAVDAISGKSIPMIVVTAPAGSTVTATNGTVTVTGTATSDTTKWNVQPTAYGTWTVTVAKDGGTRTSVVNVTEDLAVDLTYEPVFADNSWSEIIDACANRMVPDTWTIGSSKTISIGGVDYQVDIIGKNHDDLSDGSGKAPLTLQLHDCYSGTYAMNLSATNVNAWSGCYLRSTYLPPILELFPASVRAAMREVSKLTATSGADSTIETTADKLFLLSEVEVVGAALASVGHPGEGTQYAYYDDLDDTSRRIKKQDGTAKAWRLRSPRANDSNRYVQISADGTNRLVTGISEIPISFAFCL